MELNRICKELRVGKLHRNTVPFLTPIDKIQSSLNESLRESEEWKTMKIVVLGNGGIGKTTLVSELLQYAQTNLIHKVKALFTSPKVRLNPRFICAFYLTQL